jgi:NADH-quinone oxidoreductase subunit H
MSIFAFMLILLYYIIIVFLVSCLYAILSVFLEPHTLAHLREHIAKSKGTNANNVADLIANRHLVYSAVGKVAAVIVPAAITFAFNITTVHSNNDYELTVNISTLGAEKNIISTILEQVSIFSLLLGLVIFLLINIAFATLAERKIMASIQRRTGPNVVGFLGFLQPFADGLKAILKEPIIPRNANFLLFLVAPNLVLFLSLVVWIFVPLTFQSYTNFSLTLLYITVISVLEIYGTLFAGWASNSKYALLGGLRSTAQMISYEISLGFVLLCIILFSGSVNLIDIVLLQYYSNVWLIIPLLPLALIFSICMLAETNRTPFDLPEAEAELVAGYNVEYSGLLFAFFFLGEYSNMLFLSSLFTLLFLGGWTFFSIPLTSDFVNSMIFASKALILFLFFIWVRATLPRYRYDQLMNIGWQIFLPITFGVLIFLLILFFFFDTLPYQSDQFFLYAGIRSV